MPPEEEIGEVINYVKVVTPSVKDKDHGKFSFYKPPLDCPIRVSHSLSGFQLTQKDLGNPLFIPLTIGEVFPEKGADCRFNVDIIVHVDSGENDEAQLPPETELDANMITEVPNEVLPKFVEQLKLESHLQRSPHWHDINQDAAFVRFCKDVELLHYIDALVDRHLLDQAAYRLRAVSHVYSLLRRFAIAFPSESPHGPRLFLDFHIFYLKKRDQYWMLLQASCLVRLGNALILDKSPTFFVKVFYINYDYHVDEYTLYQKGSEPSDDKVEYYKTSYILTNKHHMFDFIFQIYNFLKSIIALHARLSPQLSNILLSILTESEGFPYLMAWRKRGAKNGASSSFKRRNQQSTSGPSSTTGTSVQTTITVPNLNPSAHTRLR
ncbi:hypothetical protein H4582DRAFT_2058047 [Lactarius indigo]|nr:hypothetical protein H4582DRAFT_2058047 [Lactarius indigo]